MKRRELLALKTMDASAMALRSGSMNIELDNVEILAEGSPFAGQFTPDRSKAYIEFDVCNCLPVVAGPTSGTGNYIGYHPAVLSKCHGTLLHQQNNLHHQIKAYDPKNIKRDYIVGCIVGTSYAKMPEGGWLIPEKAADSIPIRACAVLFKNAEGAAALLSEIQSGGKGKKKWSVSIEVLATSFQNLGIWVPSKRQLIPLLEIGDDLIGAISFHKETKRLIVGKANGEQLVLVYGSTGGDILFQGVGYTPTPAEKKAVITSALASVMPHDESLEEGDGFLAMRASTVEFLEQEFSLEELSRQVNAYCAGASVVKFSRTEKVYIPGSSFNLQGTEEDPAVLVKLRAGQFILKSSSDLQKILSKN